MFIANGWIIFNFFNDREGIPQRNGMLCHFTDLAYPLKNLSGTFYGYSHDEFKRDINNMSRLDHIFTKGFKKIDDATAHGWSREMLEKREYPSDHLMIIVDVGEMR